MAEKEIPGFNPLPFMRGCKQGIPLGELWSPAARLGGGYCYKLSPAQEKILQILYDAGNGTFHRLTVSNPSWTWVPPQSYEWHPAGGNSIDFIVPGVGGAATFDPDLMRAFLFLSGPEGRAAGFVGGVGIGIRGADPHLHVDGPRAQPSRWIELEKPPNYQEVTEANRLWPVYLDAAKKIYRWNSDDPQLDRPPAGGWGALPFAAAAVGGAWGYSDGLHKAALYAAGGFAAGYIVDAILAKLGVKI